MGEHTFHKIKKTMAVLLLVLFVVSVTAAAVSANQADYNRGFKDGLRDGYKYGFEQCKKDQPRPFTQKYAVPAEDDYDRGYAEGYDQGFQRGYDACEPYPVADFFARPTYGKAPLKVQFSDMSTGSPAVWKWSFGDGTYSADENPVHKYRYPGKYTVRLTVKNKTGSDTETKYNYINVRK